MSHVIKSCLRANKNGVGKRANSVRIGDLRLYSTVSGVNASLSGAATNPIEAEPNTGVGSSSNPFFTHIKKEKLISCYEKNKNICYNYQLPNELVNPKGVFANNELDLKDIQVYGFDYDYTLAYYNHSLYQLIFNLARDSLVETYKYPAELKNLEYLPHFPIRGLHLDTRKGWLMKIDSYHNIQLGTVYHGMNKIDDEDVLRYFDGQRLNIEFVGNTQTSSKLHHFVDLFCLPEICLVACAFSFFHDKGIHFTPEYIFHDVHEAVNSIHRNQILHKKIAQSIDDYLLPVSDESNVNKSRSIYIKEFLYRLNKNGKSVFLITNSPYWFVNFGMQALCGSDWTNLFDVIICNARKPYFFSSRTKPFRQFNIKTNSKSWERVKTFKKSNIYYEGNLFEMLEHTGWIHNQILYFGDHIYGDLAEPFLKHGWRTGAILNE
jgi:HAD superfamily 5'-nucleotidase-like hydrolase